MQVSSSMFRTPTATPPRVSVSLACVLDTGSGTFDAVIRNLSYSGAALSVAENLPQLARGTEYALQARGLGRLAVQIRWQRPGGLGLVFVQKRSIRAQLDAYFQRIGEYPH